jgi:hypothetical protein
VKRPAKGDSRNRKRRKGATPVGPSLPPRELTGLLDDVKATVITLLASLQEKERGLRQRLRDSATPGVKTGLSDIRLLRHWANRTLRTIGVLEQGQPGELRTLLEDLTEFRDIVHAHDAEGAVDPQPEN